MEENKIKETIRKFFISYSNKLNNDLIKSLQNPKDPKYQKIIVNPYEMGDLTYKIDNVFCHSIDSRLGHIFEDIAKEISKINYKVFFEIDNLKCDLCVQDKETDIFYIMELKSNFDIDSKKVKAEYDALQERKQKLSKNENIDINKIQIRICSCKQLTSNKQITKILTQFKPCEILTYEDFWNFICKSKNGCELIMNEYIKNKIYINDVIIKNRETCIKQFKHLEKHENTCFEIEKGLW